MVNVVWENCQDKIKLKDDEIKAVELAISEAIRYEGINYDTEINLIFTDNEEIKELNRENRGIDKETDVLSFPMLDCLDGKVTVNPYDLFGGVLLLGDIVISAERAKYQAEEYGHSLKRELGFLAVHSVLHLLGYDHEKGKEDEEIMFKKQEEILEKIGLVR